MTAHEHQDERVVRFRRDSAGRLGRRSMAVLRGRNGFAATTGLLATHVIGDTPAGNPDPPRARIVGHASCGHWSVAATSASCTASSASAKSPKRRTTAPSTCGARSRNRRSANAQSGRRVTAALRVVRSSPGGPRSACSWARRRVRARPTRTPRFPTRAPRSRHRLSSSRRGIPVSPAGGGAVSVFSRVDTSVTSD